MKFVAKILTMFTLMILFTNTVEAADLQIDSGKIFVRQANIVPRQHRRFVPPINIPRRSNAPRKEYFPRVPVCPKPRYTPNKPPASYDKRGGNRKNFGPPQFHRI